MNLTTDNIKHQQTIQKSLFGTSVIFTILIALSTLFFNNLNAFSQSTNPWKTKTKDNSSMISKSPNSKPKTNCKSVYITNTTTFDLKITYSQGSFLVRAKADGVKAPNPADFPINGSYHNIAYLDKNINKYFASHSCFNNTIEYTISGGKNNITVSKI